MEEGRDQVWRCIYCMKDFPTISTPGMKICHGLISESGIRHVGTGIDSRPTEFFFAAAIHIVIFAPSPEAVPRRQQILRVEDSIRVRPHLPSCTSSKLKLQQLKSRSKSVIWQSISNIFRIYRHFSLCPPTLPPPNINMICSK